VFKVSTLVAIEPEDAQADEDEVSPDRVVAPKDLDPADAAAYKELQQAMSRLLRGQRKAAIELACDAVNRLGIAHGLHGYADAESMTATY
jgi:hypothetical protein